MNIEVRRTEYSAIAPMRALYRREAGCQIVRDSILERGLADSFLLLCDGRPAGYAGVWNRHWTGRIMEFYVLPHWRRVDTNLPSCLLRALVAASGATHIEAQTNIPGQLTLLLEAAVAREKGGADPHSVSLNVENWLFADSHVTNLPPPTLDPAEVSQVFTHHREPIGPWCIEGNDGAGTRVLATGGYLTHYNPPYADVYMEVDAAVRRCGIGAYLVQELKRVCYEAGYVPETRCDTDNVASRQTLLRAGFRISGQFVSASVRLT